jgi:hypothetical protein
MRMDLGVEFPDFGGTILLRGSGLSGKGRYHVFLGLTLPTGDLCRMHVVLTGQLGQGQFAGQGLERPLALNFAENFRRWDIESRPPCLRNIA